MPVIAQHSPVAWQVRDGRFVRRELWEDAQWQREHWKSWGEFTTADAVQVHWAAWNVARIVAT